MENPDEAEGEQTCVVCKGKGIYYEEECLMCKGTGRMKKEWEKPKSLYTNKHYPDLIKGHTFSQKRRFWPFSHTEIIIFI